MTQIAARRWVFWAGLAVVTLVIAGFISYIASSDPDGLDSVTLKGCQVIDGPAGQQLVGSCIAQHASQHPMTASPLAGYTIGGSHLTGGPAGVIGAVVTLAVAVAAFWLIARGRRSRPTTGR